MAVVIAFRIAIALVPAGVAITRYVTSHDPTRPAEDLEVWYHRLFNPTEDLAALSADMTAEYGRLFTVTDFSGAVEGRKMAVRWSRTPSGGIVEDQAQVSMHFLKIASAAPAAWVDNTDDATVETAFQALWTTIKVDYHSATHLDVFRWYKSGPLWEVETPPSPYNPAYRTTEVDVAGTSANNALPPQVAASVTFKTSIRKRWGRVYMPAPDSNFCTTTGRITNSRAAAWATAWQTFLNACTTAHIQPVVMSRALAGYTTAPSTRYPAGHAIATQPFTYYAISSLQIDDLFDVIRSRRYSAPLNRNTATVTAAT